MKLVLAIINNDESTLVSSALTSAGFFVTRLSTTGGFLMVGNTTLLIGTEDARTPEVISILENHCTTRTQSAVPTASFGIGMKKDSLPCEVNVGGATIFVLNVEETRKI